MVNNEIKQIFWLVETSDDGASASERQELDSFVTEIGLPEHTSWLYFIAGSHLEDRGFVQIL